MSDARDEQASEAATGLRGRAVALWKRTERYHDVFAFILGFGYDTATLRRVDQLVDNLTLLAYLLALDAVLVVERRIAHGRLSWPWGEARSHWIAWVAQFLFGGLYSAYVIFYFKSATPGRTLAFLAVLVALMLVNEFFFAKLRFEQWRIALYDLCAFSFLLFFIPVLAPSAITWPLRGVFVLAGLGALVLGRAVVAGIYWPSAAERAAASPGPPIALDPPPAEAPMPSEDGPPTEGARRPPAPSLRAALRSSAAWWGVLWGGLLLLDLAGVIPPVPLALDRIGVYHNVERTDAGYALTYADPGLFHPLTWDDRVFHHQSGERVYCFSAIFAPRGAALSIFHRWERYDGDRWVETDRIPFEIRGGRDGGYRGYTAKRSVQPGEWRVRVETELGRELGRTQFRIDEVPPDYAPEWTTEIAD